MKEFLKSVNSGFQASDSLHTGVLHATSPDGDMLREVLDEAQQTPSSAQTIRWAYTMNPVYTWGGSVPSEEHGTEQDGNLKSTNGNEDEDTAVDGKSTTGWMALSPAFDPQWQICLAHATATGWVEIDGRKIEFEDVAAYVEKNWGAGFPPKWFWLQSNLFEGHPDLTVTAVGAKKRTVQPVGGFVDVGLIGIHFENEFIECVPWNAAMAWQVDPWGSWKVSHQYELTSRHHIKSLLCFNFCPLRKN